MEPSRAFMNMARQTTTRAIQRRRSPAALPSWGIAPTSWIVMISGLSYRGDRKSRAGRLGAVSSRSAARPATGTIVLLTRLARAVYMRSSVDLVGMALRNMVVLAYLRDHPGASQQVMTEMLSMDSNTGVLVLNDLEDLEYVERRRDPADRRRHIVDITEAGLEALKEAELAQGSIEDEILVGLNESERATFRALLVKALEDHDPPTGA
jgi:DNA-binding MarR family transcriptional regulator